MLAVAARISAGADNTVLLYRWLRDGAALDGDSTVGFPFNATLVIANFSLAKRGVYSCSVERCAAQSTLHHRSPRAPLPSAGGTVVSTAVPVDLLILPSFVSAELLVVSSGPAGFAVSGAVDPLAGPLLVAYGARLNASFSGVRGSAPLSYSWRRDGFEVATTAELMVASATVRLARGTPPHGAEHIHWRRPRRRVCTSWS